MSLPGQDEDSLYERIQETSAFLQKHTKRAPRFGLILGTGLGDVAQQIEAAQLNVERRAF